MKLNQTVLLSFITSWLWLGLADHASNLKRRNFKIKDILFCQIKKICIILQCLKVGFLYPKESLNLYEFQNRSLVIVKEQYRNEKKLLGTSP